MVALDAQGWSSFPLHSSAKNVYLADVASGGDDGNDGLTELTPVATPSVAYDLCTHGQGDHLLVKRDSDFGLAFGHWKKSGLSADYPMVIGTYGSGARPVFNTGTAFLLYTSGGGGSPSTIDFLAITDIEATAQSYVGNGGGDVHGVSFAIASAAITIEGCRFTNFTNGINFTGSHAGHASFRIRRNDSSNNFGTTGAVGHGIYLGNAQDLWVVEENVCDSNSASNGSEMRHGIYMPEGSNGTFGIMRRNISSRNSSHAFNLRCGGRIENNLALQSAIAFYVAGMNGAGSATYAPEFEWNVALDGANIPSVGNRGHAFTTEKWVGGTCKHNIWAHNTTGSAPACWSLAAQTFSGVAMEDNHFYKWEGGSTWQASAAQLAGCTMSGCSWDHFTFTDFVWDWQLGVPREQAAQAVAQSGNRIRRVMGNSTPIYCNGSRTVAAYGTLVGDATISSAANSFPSPERTIVTYVQNVLGIGGGGLADFIAGARANQKGAWNVAYTAAAVNDYIREGFGVQNPPSTESGNGRIWRRNSTMGRVATTVAAASAVRVN